MVAEILIANKVQREGEICPVFEDVPWAKPPSDFNHRGWCCPHCMTREYPDKAGVTKCGGCGELYRVPYPTSGTGT